MGSPDFDRRALALAMAKIRENPVGVAALMVRKVPGMWADESYGVKWVFHPKNPRALEMTSATTRRLLTLASQAVYACLTVMAAVAVLRRRQPDQALLLMILIFLAVAAVHLVVEIQPRYHAYLVPLMCVIAGACFLPRRAHAREQPARGRGARANDRCNGLGENSNLTSSAPRGRTRRASRPARPGLPDGRGRPAVSHMMVAAARLNGERVGRPAAAPHRASGGP